MIRHTFGAGQGGEVLKEVKNKKDARIPLYASLKPIFEAMPANMTPFVFVSSKTGKRYTKNINRDIWNPACKKVLGYVFPLNNSCRHSFANILAEQGVDMETISHLLRHSHVGVTEKHYANPSLEAAKRVVDNVRKI